MAWVGGRAATGVKRARLAHRARCQLWLTGLSQNDSCTCRAPHPANQAENPVRHETGQVEGGRGKCED